MSFQKSSDLSLEMKELFLFLVVERLERMPDLVAKPCVIGLLQTPTAGSVVSYDFKEERFSRLHRSAIGFPEERFFFFGTPAPLGSREGAMKGEVVTRAQFQLDPYGCSGTLHRKKLKRDLFHRAVPYPAGCPELKDFSATAALLLIQALFLGDSRFLVLVIE